MEYRLYFLDLANCIDEYVSFECNDDELAVAIAEQHAAGRPVELWNTDRLILRNVPPETGSGF